MERQVGEIFEYNGEWYQCVEGTGCYKCAFYDKNICIANNPHCTCRSDKKNVIFKKLEKVGEPYEYFIRGMGIIIVQEYILANASYIYDDNRHVVMMDCQNGRIAIEIKQNKEDMEEKKLNLKPFDLEAAKDGKPVCTRDGRKARIICFDRNWEYPIVALIEYENGEEMISACDKDGKARIYETQGTDLMMLIEKKEGYVNIYTNPRVGDRYSSNTIFPSKEEAIQGITKSLGNYINTTKIEWEE
jgi:hypothetical protein